MKQCTGKTAPVTIQSHTLYYYPQSMSDVITTD